MVLLVVALAALTNGLNAGAETRQELTAHAQRVLKKLYAANKAARLLGEKAKGVLIFPEIVKAGFMVGGQVGDGVMLKGGKPSGYYNTVAGSYGLQAGVQTYGYALFFMNDGALQYLDSSDGFEVGVGPSIVVVDAGVGKEVDLAEAF
jgi:lipid-binding SYLF domain-containing protein